MEYVELKTDDEFYDLGLKEDEDIFNELVERFPEESAEALSDFVEFQEEVGNLSDRYLKFFFEIFDYDELIEWIDDFLDDEFLVNYYVKDGVVTDRGVWESVLYNGYMLK